MKDTHLQQPNPRASRRFIRQLSLLTTAILAFGFLGGKAFSQVDLTGDGRLEVVICRPGQATVVVHDGFTGNELWRHSGPASSLLGWSATAHPDLDGDGRADVIVTAPGVGSGDPGFVRALRGFDGQVLWTRPFGMPADSFGLGVGVIPDQTADGVPDLVVAMLSNNPSGEAAVLLDCREGNALASKAGPVGAVLEAARRGAAIFKTLDLDGSGIVDGNDVLVVAGLIGSSEQFADVDFNGVVETADLSVVIDAVVNPAPQPQPPSFYLTLVLEDPFFYNDGYALVSLGRQAPQPGGGGGGAAWPPAECSAEAEAAKQAWEAYALHYFGLFDLIGTPAAPALFIVWLERQKQLREAALAAQQALDNCLAGLGYPPWKPGGPPPENIPPPPPPAGRSSQSTTTTTTAAGLGRVPHRHRLPAAAAVAGWLAGSVHKSD